MTLSASRKISWLSPLLALWLASCATPPAPPEPEIISKIPGYRREVHIVSRIFSPDRKSAVITLHEPSGIFAFRLDLSGANLSRLTLIVQKQKYCEGLTFQPDAGRVIELPYAPGVKIFPAGEDMKIEFTRPALDLMKAGGRVHYINQYR